MIISTKHLVEACSCRSFHRQPVSMYSIDTFIGKVYADALWLNTPEQGGPG